MMNNTLRVFLIAVLVCLALAPRQVQAATQNASDQRFANNADGFSIGGGTTARTLTLITGDITLVGNATPYTYNFPAPYSGATATLVGLAETQTLTHKSFSGNVGIGTTAPVAALHIGDAGSLPNVMSSTGNDLYVLGNIELDGRIYGDGSGLTGTSPITIVNTSNLFSTGLTGAGAGVTTASDSNFFGVDAGNGATGANRSNFFGNEAGNGATNANNSNFFGYVAGKNATGANHSNFFGEWAGWAASGAFDSNFIGREAGNGATNASNSNFIGNNAGLDATDALVSNFIGLEAGISADNAIYSNFIGNQAGRVATNASYSNFFGTEAGTFADSASYSNLFGYKTGRFFGGNNIGSNNIIIGTNISLPNATANAINLGGVIFATGTYSTTTGNPSILPVAGGNVGIGTHTPVAQFQVGVAPNIPAGSSPAVAVRGNLVVDGKIYGDGSGLTNVVGAVSGLTATRVPVASGSTTLIDSGIYYVGGNVGIGTISPSAQLDVNGSINLPFTSSINFNNQLSGALTFNSFYTSSALFYFQGWNGAIQTNMVINSVSGNVGIGTENPVARLHIGGGAMAVPSAMSITGGDLYVKGNIEFDGRIYGDGSALTGVSSITGLNAGYISRAGSPTTIVDSAIYQNGNNIGIGSLLPVARLDIRDGNINLGTTTSADIGVITKNGRPFIHDFHYDDGSFATEGNNTFVGYSAGNFTMGSTSGDSDNSSKNTAVGASALWSNTLGHSNTAIGASAMSLNTEGHNNTAIGIGALSFNTTGGLNIAIGRNAGSNTADSSSNETSSSSIYLGPSTRASVDGGGNEIVIGYEAVGAGSNSAVLGNDSIVITALKGNVGLGTTVPAAKLFVADAGSLPDAMSITGSDLYVKGNIEFDGRIYGDGSRLTGVAAANPTVNNVPKSNGTTLIDSVIYSVGGNVGIGTSVPTSTLEVAGGIASIGAGDNYFMSNLGIGTTLPPAMLAVGVGAPNAMPVAGGDDLFVKGNIEFDGKIYGDGSMLTGLASGSGTVNPGVTGYFSYYPSSGTAVDDQAVLYTNTTNIGIGTTAPPAVLSVGVGTPNAMPVADGNDVYIAGNLEVDGKIYGDGSALTGVSSITGLNAGYISRANSPTTIVDSFIYQNGSNIGIGTLSPAASLHVIGGVENAAVFANWTDLGLDTTITIGGNDPGRIAEQYITYRNVDTGASGWMVGMDDDETFRFDYRAVGEINESNALVTIRQNGNVGIGTTLPPAALAVGLGTPNAMPVADGNDVYIAGNLEVDGRIYGDGSGLTGVSSITGLTDNYITRANGTSAIENSIIYDTGTNVGIGTIDPVDKFEVSGGNIKVRESSATGGYIDLSDGGSMPSAYQLGKGTVSNAVYAFVLQTSNIYLNDGGRFYLDGGTDTYITQSGNDAVSLSTGDGFIMGIADGGNVGIGTTAPLAKLQVGLGAPDAMPVADGNDVYIAGNLEVDGKIYGDGSQLTGVSSISGLTDNYITRANGTSAIENSIIYDTGTNIGIGTTVPVSRLEIVGAGTGEVETLLVRANPGGTGATSSNNIIFANTYGAGNFKNQFMLWGNGAQKWALGNDMNGGGVQNFYIWDEVAGSVRLFINNVGNIGIGTSAPLARLQVGIGAPNVMSSTGSDTYINGNLEVDGRIYGDGGGLTNIPGAITGLTDNYIVRANGTTAIENSIMYDTGTNIGIGSTVPGYTLDIVGGLHSNKYVLGTDLSLIPVSGGQSVISTWWGLQLVGNRQNNVDYTPADIGASSDFSVIIPNQQPTKIGLIVQGAAAQSGSLQQWRNSAGTPLAVVASSGNVGIGTTVTPAALAVGVGAPNAMPVAGGDDVYVAGHLEVDGRIYGDGGGLTNIPGAITGLTDNYIVRANGTSAIENSIMYDAGTNIGIGTTAPLAQLQVGTGAPSLTLTTPLGANDALVKGRLEVDNNIYVGGDVGINATAPMHPLEVISLLVAAYTPVAGFFAPSNTPAGNASQIRFGVTPSSGNSAEWRYVHQASNNALNRTDFGFFGYAAPVMSYLVSGNVGIGTTVPRAALAIGVGTPNAMPAATGGDDVYIAGNLEVDGRIYGDAGGLTNIPGAISGLTDNYIVRANGTAAIEDSIIFDNSINIGISTSAPLAKLDIVGAGTTTATSALIIRDSNRTAKVTVLDNGNVGIGTPTPVNKLTVFGGVTSLDSVGGYATYAAGSGAASNPRGEYVIGSSSGDAITNAGFTVSPGVSAGTQKWTFLEIRTNPVNSASTYRFQMSQTPTRSEFISSSNTGSSVGNPIYFTTQGAGYTFPAIFIDNNASQNVGIGTNVAVSRLHVSTDNSLPNAMSSTGSDLYVRGNIEFDGRIYGDGTGLTGTSTLWDAIGDPAGAGSIAFGATVQTMDWATASTQNALTINANALTSGRGLSVASSSAGLTGDLVNITASANNAGVTGSVLKVGLTGAAAVGTALNVTTAGAAGSFGLRVNDDGTYTDATPFIIDATGNVGIGTANTVAKIMLGPDSTQDIAHTNELDVIAYRLSASPTASDRAFGIFTSSAISPLVSVLNSGNVGIGTTTPVSTLEIAPAGTLAVPQGTAATVAKAGHIAVDTTDDQLIYYGSAKRVIPYERTVCITLENLSDADDNFGFFSATDDITLARSWCHCQGTCTTAATIALEIVQTGTAGPTVDAVTGTATCPALTTTPTPATLSGNVSLTALDLLRFDVTNTPAPTTDKYTLCVAYTYNAQ